MATNAEFTRTFNEHGKPAWLAPDGRIIPVVAGASDAGVQDPQQQQNPDQPEPDTQQAPQPQTQPDGLQIPVEPQVPQQGQQPQDGDQVFTREDIEKARREEKDKLYSRIETMQEEVKRLAAEREEREKAEAEARRQAEEEARRQAEEEMDVRTLLQTKEQEWNSRFEALQHEREQERALFEKEREFQTVQQYRDQRLAEEREEIMPELIDLITGTTPEEVEASIALAKDKTARILQQIQAQQQMQRQGQRTASVTAPPAAGPMDSDTTYQTVTADDIRNMDMNEYAKNREKYLAAIRQQTAQRGPYSG